MNSSKDEDEKNSQDRAWSDPKVWEENDIETSWDVKSKVCDRNSVENEEITMEGPDNKSNHAHSTPKSIGDERTLVSVLVLEMVGDVMPRFVSLDAIEFVYYLSFKPHVQIIFATDRMWVRYTATLQNWALSI